MILSNGNNTDTNMDIKSQGKLEKNNKIVNYSEKYRREEVDNVLNRRFFVIPSYQIYGGVAGFYDFGPPGCALKNNIENVWREHFILEENMLEVSGPCLTPEIVLKTSGHVDKFSDFMVKDLKNGNCFRADKLIQETIDKILSKKKNISDLEIEELTRIHKDSDSMSDSELNSTIRRLGIKNPDTGGDLSDVFPFNLMFETQIGPTGTSRGYLRPETAQGHFVNFKKLLEFNNGRIPFASACIGLGFRNEISPRSGLLRVREFTMAEIEHYVDPKNKLHKKFSNVKDLQLPLWTANLQDSNQPPTREFSLSSAVKAGIINNETLAYFLGRTYHFLLKIGISSDGIRFRQHRKTEMAHYASDCWDAEVETSYGWIEVAGHADRTCFDLSRHSQASGKDLVASKPLDKPVTVNLIRASLNQKNLYSTFKEEKAQNQEISRMIENLTNEDKERLCKEYEQNKRIKIMVGQKEISLNSDMITFERYSETQHEEKYTPGVIEPSFGMGRITYCVLEHCFRVRDKDQKRTFFAFPPIVSPYKVSILPLIDDEEMHSFIEPIRRSLIMNSISYKVDDGTDSVGKRYARTDEIGIPFGITIDKDTINDKTVTLREISTMKQIRISINEVANVLREVTSDLRSWSDVLNFYPLFQFSG